MKIDRLDHLVMAVKDETATCDFYSQVMGMEVDTFAGGKRRTLVFGRQRINLLQQGTKAAPIAENPTPGSADLCFIAAVTINEVIEHLQKCSVPVEEGPVIRTGATGQLESVYFRDPDMNLIEVSNYLK